jgi:hypothetical protein
MLRFLRILILSLIVLAGLAYLALYLSSDWITEQIERRLTASFVAAFAPAQSDEYGYEVALHFFPPVVDVTDLRIDARALLIDGDVFENCSLHVDKIVCGLISIFREDELRIRGIEGRRFTGFLSCGKLAKRLERTGGALSDVTVDQYGRRARIRARVGHVEALRITVTGTWGIDNRGVVTLMDREYTNPDSYVPEGAVQIIEEQTSFDVRLNLLDRQLIADQVSFNSGGLTISAHD